VRLHSRECEDGFVLCKPAEKMEGPGYVEFGEELATERTQAGAAIENDDLVVGADFDAGCISAVTNGGRTGSGDGAADAPEF
jgi:hypothetical protein